MTPMNSATNPAVAIVTCMPGCVKVAKLTTTPPMAIRAKENQLKAIADAYDVFVFANSRSCHETRSSSHLESSLR